MSEHDFSTELLPWLVNNTLEAGERQRVQLHVDVCSECQRDVALLTDIQSGLQSAGPSPLVPAAHPDALLKTVGTKSTVGNDIFRGRNVAIAASVAALLIVGIVLLNRPVVESELTLFETATSQDQALKVDYVFNLQFEPATQAKDKQRVLDDISARDITTLESDGGVRFVLQLPAISVEDLDRFTDELATMPEVRSVTTVAVQLPVRNPDK